MSLLPGSLLSTEWLEEHMLEPSVRVVDIRGYVKTVDAGTGDGKQISAYVGALDEYDAGHIPGAVYVDWTSDITDPDEPVSVQIAPPERFKAAMEMRGIGDETDVVVVDLPAPLGPSTPKISPCSTLSETSRTAIKSPNRRDSCSVWMTSSRRGSSLTVDLAGA